MKENQERLLNIFKMVNIEISDDVVGGEIESIEVDKKSKTWSCRFSFKNVLPISKVTEIEEKFTHGFKDVFKVKEFSFSFAYESKEVASDVVCQYYEYILKKCVDKRPRYTIFSSYTTNFTTNKVSLYVGSEVEAKCLKELVPELEKGLKNHGLKYVEIEVNVSGFEVPLTNKIDQNFKRMEDETIREQEQYDRYASQNKEKENNNKGIKPRKAQSKINGKVTPLSLIPATATKLLDYNQIHGDTDFVIEGDFVKGEIMLKKEYKIFEGLVTDGTDSIIVKTFLSQTNPYIEEFFKKYGNAGERVRIYGSAEYDKYSRDVVLKIKDSMYLGKSESIRKYDKAEIKRVELHAHTKMSTQDGIMDVKEYVKTGMEYEHPALAITDHNSLQALPDLYKETLEKPIKPIFGLEGTIISEDDFKIAFTEDDIPLADATYVVYDLETTGLYANFCQIIQIGAYKIKNGEVIDEFATFVKPSKAIPLLITKKTGISENDVKFSDPISVVLPKFMEFIKGSILVGHNVSFDNSCLYKAMRDLNLFEKELPTIDTLSLARVILNLKKYKLGAVAKYFGVEYQEYKYEEAEDKIDDEEAGHDAHYDARVTSEIFLRMMNSLENITNYNQLNSLYNVDDIYKYVSYPHHITMLAKNHDGVKNLNKIVSDSQTVHFFKTPKLLKSFLNEHREGLLVGSSCYAGKIFNLALTGSYEALVEECKYYDYIEVQPPLVYYHIVEVSNGDVTKNDIDEIILKIIRAAKEADRIVVATGDVHHINKEDLEFRKIFTGAPMVGNIMHDLKKVNDLPSQHYRTTYEMLDDFEFLNKDLAYEIVVTNTNKIANMIENFPLFPDKLFAPKDDFMAENGVPSIKGAVETQTFGNARKRYGENLPPIIFDRITNELEKIINKDYASIYYISHLLVKHSRDAGYVVGSRGSVGSSLVAYFMNITEVNALPPHYICKKCHFSIFKLTAEGKEKYPQGECLEMFDKVLQSAGTGYDLPDAKCPICGEILDKDGCDIPFETFLGIKGEKVPDIDLNFSGEYQSKAHEFCRELFGQDHAFRAGTISTIAEKTAFGYVKGYMERSGKEVRQCEIDRLASRIVGVKRSTGQHPGGIVIVPRDIEYSDIIAVQYPADDTDSSWRTTHYDYHKFESNLLKMDILGHDDPTMIRHLMNFVQEEPDKFPFSVVEDIPLSDRKVLGLFSSCAPLGVDSNQINSVVGTTGLPEFGTTLAKEMLREINPKTVNELIKISGLSHGTDVWNGNARDYMLGLKPGIEAIPFKDLIGCRDDIMVSLDSWGVPVTDAFKIMESVRKGKGVSQGYEKEMLEHGVPNWYIDSCKMIKYMFPKAHATAYVIMALRIGWFKVYRPIYYYAAYFSRRANAFDPVTMVEGYKAIYIKVKELEASIKAKSATPKEQDLYVCLNLALEMTARGFKFKQIDILESDWRDFLIEGDTLLIPFKALDALGESTAQSIVEARNAMPFINKQDILKRTKINKTVFDKLNRIGAFKTLDEGLPTGILKS